MPVCNQVMGDPIQPRRKRHAAIRIIFDVIHRPLKHTGCKILRIVYITGSVIYIIEDAIHVLFIQTPKRVAIARRGAGQDIIFVEVNLRQEKFLPAELNQITPPGFRSYREYNMQHFKTIESMNDAGWYN